MGEARDVGERWFGAIESGDTAALRALLTEDCDFATPNGLSGGPDQAIAEIGVFLRAFPDARFTVSNWIEGDGADACEGVYSGTHTGLLASPQGDVPPTGRSVAVPFATVFEAADGRLTKHHVYWDNASFLMQLGLGPPPGP